MQIRSVWHCLGCANVTVERNPASRRQRSGAVTAHCYARVRLIRTRTAGLSAVSGMAAGLAVHCSADVLILEMSRSNGFGAHCMHFATGALRAAKTTTDCRGS
jgi:hypothetical protein